MPRATTNKLYRSFVKGLITEASPLTYPEDSSFDELNTIPNRNGSRRRRLGQFYSSDSIDNTVTFTGTGNLARTEYVWKTVGNRPNTNFLCVQNSSTIYFYDLNIDSLLDSKKAFSINLETYLRPGGDVSTLRDTPCFFASGKGLLFVVNEQTEPLSIEYNTTTDTISVTSIKILIRDFEGLQDNLQNDEEPTSLTAAHHYNLQNQGWVLGNKDASTFSPTTLNGYTYDPVVMAFDGFTYIPISAFQTPPSSSPIFTFYNALGRYPGNNKQWWVAKAEIDDDTKGIKQGDFLPLLLDKLFSGNNKAPRGHYIVDAFRKDRSAASGISGLAIEDLNIRPSAVAFFSGRAWYAAGSTVYYSQILDSNNSTKAGICYQEADPTAEDISELIASDGGEIPIPEADKIIRLVPMANGILVFSFNGVWYVNGEGAAFSATNVSVTKISPIGTNAPMSIIETNDVVFWWSEIGIQALQQASGQFGPIPGKFGNTNIAEQTIQTYYNAISNSAKPYSKAAYDTNSNIIYWLYRDSDYTGNFQYNRVLLFDITLQAFYPWKFSSITDGPFVSGLYLDVGFVEQIVSNNVTDVGANVTDLGLNVTNGESINSLTPTNITYLSQIPDQGLVKSFITDATYADWVTFDSVGVGYDSFIETGYEISADSMRRKDIIYLVAHFTRSEDEIGTNPSSCKLITKWDWSSNVNSNRWSTEVELYRPRLRPDPTTADLVEGFSVVTSKNKVRGNGKAIQFRFGTSEIGKGFDFLGWSVALGGNTQP